MSNRFIFMSATRTPFKGNQYLTACWSLRPLVYHHCTICPWGFFFFYWKVWILPRGFVVMHPHTHLNTSHSGSETPLHWDRFQSCPIPPTVDLRTKQVAKWNLKFLERSGRKKNWGAIRDLWAGTGNISCVGKRQTYHVVAGGNYWVSHTHTPWSRSRRLHSPGRVYFHLCRQKWDSFLFVQRPTLFSSRTWNNYITRFFCFFFGPMVTLRIPISGAIFWNAITFFSLRQKDSRLKRL